MWKPVDLRFDVNLMKAGEFDNLPASEVMNIIVSHQTEFEKYKGQMPATLIGECNDLIDLLKGYQKVRNSKPKAQSPKPVGKKPSPTEVFKQHFGKKPTEAYREQFGKFDKSAYAKWLHSQVKELKSNNNE